MRPDNSVWSSNTIAHACGLSGTGPGPGGRPCNLFKPGTLTGVTPVYDQFQAGTARYETDWNNLAPSVGVAWLPGVNAGLGRTILGNPDLATVRVSYARAFIREGLNRYGMVYENNPGPTFDAVRDVNNGDLVPPGETLPLLLRETSRLGPGPVPLTPVYPLGISRSAGVNMFDPGWGNQPGRFVQRRDSAGHCSRHGHRSPVHRHAPEDTSSRWRTGMKSTSSRTASSTSSSSHRGTCVEHRRRAWPDNRVRRAGHRDVAVADLPRVFHRLEKRER